jgi:hypothetical protein
MSSVKMVNTDQGLFETLQSELNHSLSIAQVDDQQFTHPDLQTSKKQNQLGGVPLWAFE